MAATQQQQPSPEVAFSPPDSLAQKIEGCESIRQSPPLAGGPQEATVSIVDKDNHNQNSGPTDSLCAAQDTEKARSEQPHTAAETGIGSQEALSQRLINMEREVRQNAKCPLKCHYVLGPSGPFHLYVFI